MRVGVIDDGDISSEDGTGFPAELLEEEGEREVPQQEKKKDSTSMNTSVTSEEPQQSPAKSDDIIADSKGTTIALNPNIKHMDSPTTTLVENAQFTEPDYETMIALLEASKHARLADLQRMIDAGQKVNFKNAFGESPLLLVLRGHLQAMQLHLRREELQDAPPLSDERVACLKLLLEHGADANDETLDRPSFTALGFALQCRSREAISLLMYHGADPATGLRAVTNVLLGVNMASVEMIMDYEVLCSSQNPIETCFILGHAFGKLARSQPERRREYKALRKQCSDLAVELFDRCPDLWDVRRLLNPASGILKKAMIYKQKAFLAHTYTQQYLNELWLGKLHGRSGTGLWFLLLACLLFPISVPLTGLWFVLFERKQGVRYSALGDLIEMLKVPFVKFCAAILSFFAFIILLVVIVDRESNKVPDSAEIAGAAWVIALILAEVRELMQTNWSEYWSSLWNVLDWIILATFTVVGVLRALVFAEVVVDSEEESLRTANYLLALACGISCLRLLHIMQAHSLFGPLQLIIAGIMKDLALFLVILAMFMIAFSLALTKVYENSVDPSGPLGSLSKTIETLIWALFGLAELDMLEPDRGDFQESAEALGKTLFALYMVVVFILLINLLIAMLSSTYNRISSNADLEWKYARAMLIRSYQEAPIVPAPLNLISEPLGFLLRRIGWLLSLCGCRFNPVDKQTGKPLSSSDDAVELAMVRKLQLKLVKRLLEERGVDLEQDDMIIKRQFSE